MIIEAKEPALLHRAAEIFRGWEETMILSCLQGVMGKIYMTDQAAAAYLGDFAFFAGSPDRELLLFRPEPDRHMQILVPRDENWASLIEAVFSADCEKTTRYAIKKDTVFDFAHLERLKNRLPKGYELGALLESEYPFVRSHPDFRDWVAQFQSFSDYQTRGLGCIVRQGNQIVAGACSYSVYNGGIEIEVQTLMEHRRKGLASAAGAALILECLNRGIYPSWDAANIQSVGLAEKLGYKKDHAYSAYYIRW